MDRPLMEALASPEEAKSGWGIAEVCEEQRAGSGEALCRHAPTKKNRR